MNTDRRRAIAALTTAGLLWGTTVPLSKLALQWLPPGWLTFARFGIAAAILLAAASRPWLRAACTPPVLASGAAGYGGSVVMQNAGIARTSVSHAALLIGAVPVLVAVIAALWDHSVARPVAWVGFAVSLAGVGLVTGGGGGGATAAGDGLVLASLVLSATFTVGQARLLRGRDPVAVTAVQFLGAALAVLPFSVVTEGMPAVPGGPGAVLAGAGGAGGGAALHAVRLRAEPGACRGGRGLPQPGTARRRGGRRRRLRRPGRPRAARRRRGHPRGYRPRRPPPAGRRASAGAAGGRHRGRFPAPG
jgi:O-acetylserine/cysteine efflux transporter